LTYNSEIEGNDDMTTTATLPTPSSRVGIDQPRPSEAPQRAEHRGMMVDRREVKYLVDRTTRTALTADLRKMMRPDPFAGEDGTYQIRSLYFDTHDFRAYHDKLSGAAIRHKLRIRAYGADPSHSNGVRLEVKSRYLTSIHKSTVDVNWEDYGQLAEAIERRVFPPSHLLQGGSVCMEFFRIRHQQNMEPKILIQYRREAYERTEVNRLRVNFDDELFATRNLDLVGPLQGARRILQYGHSVFELKADGSLPYWMHMLIAKYNLREQSVSKYCQAVRSEARLSSVGRDQYDE
jgi:hypothetical protein